MNQKDETTLLWVGGGVAAAFLLYEFFKDKPFRVGDYPGMAQEEEAIGEISNCGPGQVMVNGNCTATPTYVAPVNYVVQSTAVQVAQSACVGTVQSLLSQAQSAYQTASQQINSMGSNASSTDINSLTAIGDAVSALNNMNVNEASCNATTAQNWYSQVQSAAAEIQSSYTTWQTTTSAATTPAQSIGSQSPTAQTEEMYIGLFDRPADVSGLQYWLGQANTNGGVQGITSPISNIGNFSPNQVPSEFDNGINSSNISDFINYVYTNLFGQSATSIDNATGDNGLQYWINQWQANNWNPGMLVYQISNNAAYPYASTELAKESGAIQIGQQYYTAGMQPTQIRSLIPTTRSLLNAITSTVPYV